MTKIGLGLAALGRPEYINIRTKGAIDRSPEAFKDNAHAVLDYAYANGLRYFDTAPSYGKGEQFLLEWKTSRKHAEIILGTKWGYTYKADWELGFKGKHEIKEHSLKKLNEQWQMSQQLLPELNIYQVHSATLDSGILENTEVHQKLYDIKNAKGLKIGISISGNNQSDIIEKALEVKVANQPLFDAFQVTYNILEQSTFGKLQDLIKQGKYVIIKEALANGRVFKNEKFAHYKGLYKTLESLSKKHNVGVDAIALRFIIDNLNPTYVLSGASSKAQLRENLMANNFQLDTDDLQELLAFKINPNEYWKERNSLSWN